MSRAFAAIQRLLPQHALSRFGGRLAGSTSPWLSQLLIRNFNRVYDVNMAEAEREALTDYVSFNDFFTRALKPGARPLPADPAQLVSPADGAVSEAGRIHRGRLLQAKGHSYTLASLLGEDAAGFEGGSFVTVYLAPRDYHRVHAPGSGRLVRTRAIPGALYSVNASTESSIEGLFARNERLVCEFATEHGRMFVVMVGAMIVASIETVWPGPASPYDAIRVTDYEGAREDECVLARGAELGRFLLGSTVIVCFEKDAVDLETGIGRGRQIRMGEPIARVRR